METTETKCSARNMSGFPLGEKETCVHPAAIIVSTKNKNVFKAIFIEFSLISPLGFSS